MNMSFVTKHFVILMLLTAISTINAGLIFYLGWMWLYDGYGLHPALSFPLAPFLALLPILYITWAMRGLQEKVDELVDEFLEQSDQ